MAFSETRVPVVNMNDGSVLCGDEAPKKRRLEQWLLEHPGYMISGQAISGLPLPVAVPEEQPPPPLPDLQAVSATHPVSSLPCTQSLILFLHHSPVQPPLSLTSQSPPVDMSGSWSICPPPPTNPVPDTHFLHPVDSDTCSIQFIDHKKPAHILHHQ